MATMPLDDLRDRQFEQLYARYAKDVYRYSLAVLRNPADAEDVTQTTFMNAYRSLKETGQEIRNPQHWLIKIAHNACRTRFIRASRRPQEVPLEDSLNDLSMPEDEKPNVKAVLSALGELPFNQRSALVMRELEGRSYEEIAETLNVSVSAVETLIFRARRSLRLRKSALRAALGAVQLPGSLESFFAGGSTVATGSALIGGGVALKAAAVLVAGLVAGSAGYNAAVHKPRSTKRLGVQPILFFTGGGAAASAAPADPPEPRRFARAAGVLGTSATSGGKAASAARRTPDGVDVKASGDAANARSGRSGATASSSSDTTGSPSRSRVGSAVGNVASSLPLPVKPKVPSLPKPSLPPPPKVPVPALQAPQLPTPQLPQPPAVTVPQPPPVTVPQPPPVPPVPVNPPPVPQPKLP